MQNVQLKIDKNDTDLVVEIWGIHDLVDIFLLQIINNILIYIRYGTVRMRLKYVKQIHKFR